MKMGINGDYEDKKVEIHEKVKDIHKRTKKLED
jgi:hypothetical protein